MENPIILSFCIPTYKRPKEFERLVKRLLPQLTPEVEVVIRDDSSDDSTTAIVDRELKSRGVRCSYFHGEKIGLDAANLFLIEKAVGKYVWWFSDDDDLLPGAIESVLRIVKKHPNTTFIWANFDFQRPGNPAVRREDGFFKSGNEVLETLGTNIGLLSTLIFDREEALLSLPAARKHVVGFSFAGLVPVFSVLSGNGRFYFLRGPYILCHPTTVSEIKQITTKSGQIKNEGFNVYGIDFYNIVMEFKDKFDRRSIRKILSVNFAAMWRGMLVGWVGGWDTPKGKRWQMFRIYWSYPECWIALPIMLTPLWVNKGLYRFYKLFFNERKWRWGRGI